MISLFVGKDASISSRGKENSPIHFLNNKNEMLYYGSLFDIVYICGSKLAYVWQRVKKPKMLLIRVKKKMGFLDHIEELRWRHQGIY